MKTDQDSPDAYALMQRFAVPEQVSCILDEAIEADKDSALQCFKVTRELRTRMDLALRRMERHFAQEA